MGWSFAAKHPDGRIQSAIRRSAIQHSKRIEKMIRCGQKLSLVVGVIAMLSTMIAGAGAAENTDETAIRALNVSWEKAYNAGDANGAAALYAEDAALLPPGAPITRGHAEILAYYTKDIEESKAAGVVLALNRNTDVGVSGELGWESGLYKVTVKGAVVETGKFLAVSRKKDGKWQFIRDTWNADAPPAPPPANK
jgi:uncharacterized protein (TIGR02246 family)